MESKRKEKRKEREKRKEKKEKREKKGILVFWEGILGESVDDRQ